MSQSDAESNEQCRALTGDGNRCQNSAVEDGFCHQHDESDSTVDGESSADGDESGESPDSDGSDAGSEAEQDTGRDSSSDGGDASATDSDDGSESGASGGDEETADAGSEDDTVSIGGAGSLIEVRRTVEAVTAQLIEHPLDGVVEINRDGDGGWLATVEVVERRAVPDTQDIIGYYEITLEDSETVTGYRRLSRYRRMDTDQSERLE
ncbi:gas vesicle protein GvpO, halophile-type [Haloarcula nitratireducens]|uniref:Gas vesicle protein n=1 Tax=Haloarcula nitratireducens TaxID=2487749 RepID=A0AAW4PG55_9EURY|nr:gas vesicle protein GvpO [Halomicroarcula nitratireducens]MBX0296217.1 gas vesicle protein [Halomicroarcula nitratireducens]